MAIKDMSDTELILEAKGLFGAIFVCECYSVSDMGRYGLVCAELERRGYDLTEESGLHVTKMDEDEEE